MTHAAKSHDAFEQLERIKEELQRHAEHADVLREKLLSAEREAELALLLADLSGFLREIPTRNFSEGQRLRCNGLRKRLNDVRAA
jgi:hypothetical protein